MQHVARHVTNVPWHLHQRGNRERAPRDLKEVFDDLFFQADKAHELA